MEKRNEYISTTEKLTKFVQETSQGIKRKQASQKEKLLQVQQSNTNVQINISKGFKRFNRRQDKTKDYILEKLKDKFVHLKEAKKMKAKVGENLKEKFLLNLPEAKYEMKMR